jgi:hypothetical protein
MPGILDIEPCGFEKVECRLTFSWVDVEKLILMKIPAGVSE